MIWIIEQVDLSV